MNSTPPQPPTRPPDADADSSHLPPPPPSTHPPPLDPDTASWVLEFVLRQFSIPDSVVKEIFLALPISNPISPRLRKTIHLRRIGSMVISSSITDRTLESLELIEEIDRLTYGTGPSKLMQAAYCAVVVERTVDSLRGPHEHEVNFRPTFERIWDRRIPDLERSEASRLVSFKLKGWRHKMVRALWNLLTRKDLLAMGTQREAVDALREYLREALQAMGPPFLEVAAGSFHELGMGITGTSCRPEKLDKRGKNPEAGRGGEGCSSLPGARGEEGLDGTDFMELNMERLARLSGNDTHKGGKAVATGQDASAQDGCSSNKFDRLSTPEVSKVTEALKTSCVNLEMVVEDPLPDAITTAAGVVTNMGGTKNLKEPQKDNCQLDGNASVCASEMGPRVSRVEGCSASTMLNRAHDAVKLSDHVDPNPPGPKELEQNQDRVVVDAPVRSAGTDANVSYKDGTNPCLERNKDKLVQQRSLMERNPTAHTYEWGEDSINSSSENSENPSKKLRLPSPKRRAVSPLKVSEDKGLPRRRKRKNWSVLEEDTLREAVKKHGVGNWKFILSCYPKIFEDRTEVDLKDKWRNMTRH